MIFNGISTEHSTRRFQVNKLRAALELPKYSDEVVFKIKLRLKTAEDFDRGFCEVMSKEKRREYVDRLGEIQDALF